MSSQKKYSKHAKNEGTMNKTHLKCQKIQKQKNFRCWNYQIPNLKACLLYSNILDKSLKI